MFVWYELTYVRVVANVRVVGTNIGWWPMFVWYELIYVRVGANVCVVGTNIC